MSESPTPPTHHHPEPSAPPNALPEMPRPVHIDLHEAAPPADPTPNADIDFTPPPTESAAPTPAEPDAAQPAAEPLPKPDRPRVIAMMNQKGGVGKTTTTVSVGAALAEGGHSVLLIDLDPQAHLTLSLGFDPAEMTAAGDKTVYHLLADENVAAMEVVRQAAGYDNLAVLPAETNLAGVESELADLVRTGLAQSILRNKCRDLFSQFDTILIDCPPSLGLLTINALTAATEIIVPMQAHFLPLQGMGQLFETVRMVRMGINPQLQVSGVVLCMHEANTILAADVIRDVEGFFEAARGSDAPWAQAVLYQPPIRRNIKLAEAPRCGTPVHRYAPDSNGAADYRQLAASIAQHTSASA
ncbi:MAG: AAA family ATPase [Planctomycetota bacterium]